AFPRYGPRFYALGESSRRVLRIHDETPHPYSSPTIQQPAPNALHPRDRPQGITAPLAVIAQKALRDYAGERDDSRRASQSAAQSFMEALDTRVGVRRRD